MTFSLAFQDRRTGARSLQGDQYYLNILTQINSITAAARAVGLGLLDDRARPCVREGIECGEGDLQVNELVAAVARFTGR